MKHIHKTLFLVILIWLAGVQLSSAQTGIIRTINVGTNDDSNQAGGCSLREAIDAVNAVAPAGAFGATQCTVVETGTGTPTTYEIVLPAYTYTLTVAGINEQLNATGDLDLRNTTNPVIIRGAGAASTIIDGGAIDRILHIDPDLALGAGPGNADVTVEGITFRNGFLAGDSGLAIFNNGGNLEVIDSTFTNNSGSAGTIRNYNDGSLLVTGSTFGGSIALGNTIANSGGGIYSDTGTVLVTNSTFSHTALNSGGGAIWVGNNSVLQVIGSSFSNLSAGTGSGGAIYVNNTASVAIETSTFSNNGAGSGGAIWIGSNGNLDIADTDFDTHTTTSSGGNIFISSNVQLTLTNVSMVNNTVTTSGTGGAVFTTSGSTFIANNLTITNSTAPTNQPGGALFLNNSTTTLTNSQITNSTAGRSGAAIFVQQGSLTTNNTNITDSQGGDSGGAIFAASATTTFNGGTFSDSLMNSGGFDSGGFLFNQGGTATFNNVTVSNSRTANTNNSHGGAIFNNGTLIINGSTFDNNFTQTAFSDGGAIYTQSGTVTINNSTFSNNQTQAGESHGGALMITGGTVNVTNTLFTTNSTSAQGGAIFVNGFSNPTVTINSSRLLDNTAIAGTSGNFGRGGAIFNNLGTITLNDTTLAGNDAAQSGGAIFNNGYSSSPSATMNINRSTISGNTAPQGAGIFNNAYSAGGTVTATVTLSNSTISGNTSTGNGAAFFNYAGPDGAGTANATANLRHVTIANNTGSDSLILNSFGTGTGNPTFNIDSSIISSSGTNCNTFASAVSGTAAWNGADNLSTDSSCPGAPFTPNVSTLNLGALANNGGVTQTHALLAGSTAIDSTGATCPLVANVDQRNAPRDALCDAGAYEANVILPLISISANPTQISENPVTGSTITITVDNTTGTTSGGTITVNLLLSGTASAGFDYTPTTYSAVIIVPAAGTSTTQTFTLTALSDGFTEVDETAIVQLTFTGAAVLSGSDTVTITISEVPPVVVPPVVTPPVTNVTVTPVAGTGSGTGADAVIVGSNFIIKQVDQSLAQVGDVLTYTIIFTNPKGNTLNNVVIADVFDSRLQNVTVLTASIGNASLSGNALTLQGFALLPGQRVAIQVSAVISERARPGDVIRNTATLESPDASIHVSNAVETLIIPGALPATGQSNLGVLRWMLLIGIITLLLAIWRMKLKVLAA